MVQQKSRPDPLFFLRTGQLHLILSALLVSILLTACGSTNVDNTQKSDAGTPLAQRHDKVRVGTFGVFGDAPIYIAQERGYFREQGIDIENTPISGGLNELVTLLATNKLDVGNGAATAGLYNAFQDNINLKIVADNALVTPDDKSAAVVIRKDLLPSIKSVADLKGKKIAVLTAKGSTSLIYLEKFLKPGGLTLKDISLVALPFPNMGAALTNGSVDLAIIIEPFLTLGLAKGTFAIYQELSEIYPGAEGNVEVYTGDFAARKDLANRFALARLKGARDYYNAFFTTKQTDRDAIVQILIQHTSVKDPALYKKMNFTHLNPDGRVNSAVIQNDLDWFVKDGDVKNSLNIEQVVDHSFVDNAVRILGPYKQA